MDILKTLVAEIQDLVDENKQYEQRFKDLTSEMDTERYRMMRDINGDVTIDLKVEKRENWGYNLELAIKTRVASTTHQAYIVQIGRGEYQMTDEFDHEETIRDGATAVRTLLAWLTDRIKVQKGELAGGTLTSRVFN